MGYEKRQFLYGMDLDTEERLIQPGFSRKNVNVRIGSSTDSGVYSAENIQGNTFIPNTELPSGTNKVIGSCWDKLRDLSYYFVYNSESNHGIFEYNHVEGKINKIMITSLFNFQPDKLITGHNVVEFDKDNHLLYFTDGFNPPRKINIETARPKTKLTPLGEKTYPGTLTEDIIDAIKYPPLFPPTFEYITDPEQKVNYLIDKIVQFKAAYVYDDKEESAYSPISVQAIPDSSNVIRVTVPRGGSLVERVILAVRFGNIGDFVQVVDQDSDDYERDRESNYIYDFKNDKYYNSISLPKSNKLFDSLPQIAKAQEYIEGNRITYGNITEGYDNVDVDLGLKVDYEKGLSTSKNKIKGFVRISNPNLSYNDEYGMNQVIRKDSRNEIPVFGGYNNSRRVTSSGMIYNYHQQIPLGGFVVYLAGTDFFGVSKQVKAKFNYVRYQEGTKNIYVGDSSGAKKAIRSAIENSGDTPHGSSGAYSTFEIDDIPDGTYILRVASHLTTSADFANRAYQRTSTYVNSINKGSTRGSTYGSYQAFDKKEFKITVKDGVTVEDIEIVIADLSVPKISAKIDNIAGYVCDFINEDDSVYTPTSVADALGQKRIENAVVFYSTGRNSRGTLTQVADHNGFYFCTNINGVGASGIRNIEVGAYQYETQSFQSVIDLTTTSTDLVFPVATGTGSRTFLFLVPNKNTDIKNFSRTKLTVDVITPTGEPVEGVSVVSVRGDTQETKTGGKATFIVYDYTTALAPGGGESFLTFIPVLPKTESGSFEPFIRSKGLFIGKDLLNDEDTTELDAFVYSTEISASNSRLKNGGVYSFGIVYYDRANRSGVTNPGIELSLPFYTEGSETIKTAPIVSWEIKNLAPDWATHYQIVRTENTSSSKYLQWYTSEVTYEDGGTSFNDAGIIVLDITNLTEEYKTSNPGSVLVYDFTPGDRIRLIRDSSETFFDDYIDLSILSFETGILRVKNDIDDLDLSSGVFFEIYTPKLESSQNIYYEIGECFRVLKHTDDDGNVINYHEGGTGNQDPLNPSSTPAKGTLRGGDTYYRKRSINSGLEIYNVNIDSQLYSDSWQSKISDIGRPNIVDKNAKRVNRITTIYYSDRFIPETNINGLSSFFDTAFETYDRKYGSIQKLFSQDKRLDCYQETKSGKILVEENVIFDQFDKGTIASSSRVLSKIIYYKGDYGTLNPESFVENEGRRYWFDVRNGKVLRLSNDGITPLSDNKMHGYFESKSNFYSAFNLLPEVWGVFDENFDEYIIAFGSVSRPEGFTPDELALVASQADQITETRDGLTFTFDILYSANKLGVPTEFQIVRDLSNGTFIVNSVAGDITLDRQKLLAIPAETLGFSEKTGHWTSFYSYDPECMIRAGVDFLSFRNGQAYLHNTSNAKRNSFYGEERGSEVWAVFNQNPSNVKVFQALSEESDSVWQVRDIFTQGGQRSNLTKDDFSVAYGQGHTLYSKENIHYAPFWKDENTPNVDNPLIEGDSMRDVSILVKLINDSTKEERLFAASINYSLSERSNR